jgi:ATP-dependent DNA helicase RecG
MMFALMRNKGLYPPAYRELRDQAQEAVVVALSNEEQPAMWDQVSAWMDRHGPISNKNLCDIAAIDTLKASKLLKRWVDQALLVADTSRAKRNMVYFKPGQELGAVQYPLSMALDNNPDD